MATFTTYNSIGIAEDVSDVIVTITPSDTPMYTMFKSEKVHNRTFSYLEDSLRAAASNAKVEGATQSDITLGNPTERTGTCQIISETFKISETSDAVKTYGRAKETAYQMGRTLKNIKRDVEYAFCGASNAAATGDASTAREMASIDQLISTTLDAGANATDAMTEAKLLTLGQTCYTNGSDPNVFMIKPADAQIVAGFAAASGRNREFAQTKSLVNAIDLYVSPYGEYKVVLNRHQMTTHAFLIDPAMFKTCVLRPFARTLLAKVGDADSHSITGEMSLKHNSFADSGMITGLS